MKTKIILFMMIASLFLMGGMGCDKEKNNSDCYTGKIISLVGVGHEYYSIAEITSAPKGEIAVGTTITFNPDLFNQNLNIGSTLEFKVIEYHKWIGPATADHLWPVYVGKDVRPCKN